MTYEVRQATGTHALKCDTEGCHMELLAPTEFDLMADACSMGWQSTEPNHTCASCLRGVNAGAGAVQSILNSMGIQGTVVPFIAPGPVSKGDTVYQDMHGRTVEVGIYLADAGQGDKVDVQLCMPSAAQSMAVSPQLAAVLAARQAQRAPSQAPSNPGGYTQASGAPPAMDEDEARYQASMGAFAQQVSGQRQHEPGPWDDILDDDDEELEETSDPGEDLGVGPMSGVHITRHQVELGTPEPSLDDLFGDPKAPPRPSAGPELTGTWKDRMASLPGTAGGAGAVANPPQLDPKKVAVAKERAPKAPRPPQMDAEKLVASNDLFGFLSKNRGWTPDDK